MQTFDELQCQPELVQLLQKANIHHPTSTQARVIPELRSGRHNIVAAETGQTNQSNSSLLIRFLIRRRENTGLSSPTDRISPAL